jgi:hypothetical protein
MCQVAYAPDGMPLPECDFRVPDEELIGRNEAISSPELLQVDTGNVVVVSMEFGLFFLATLASGPAGGAGKVGASSWRTWARRRDYPRNLPGHRGAAANQARGPAGCVGDTTAI